MNFDLTDEQKMLVSGAERYVRERCSLEARRQSTNNAEGFSRQQFAQFAELGWLALPLPEDVGGLGGGDADIALLMEQLGRGLVAEPLVDSAILGATLIAHATDPAVRADILGRVATGECLLALAHVEADGRSELDTPISCRAEKSPGGWVLQGTKHRVFYGNSADYWLVSARIDNEPALFMVDSTRSGVRIESYRLIDGTCAADLHLDATALPANALLLRGDTVQTALDEAIDRAILALSASLLGSMEIVMALTADYLKTREQYGSPLAQFQSLQHRMAEMLIETEQARSMLYRALAAVENGDVRKRRVAIAGAKVLIARAGLFVTAQGIQLHGGIGVTEEYAVGHHYKAALVYNQRFGDASMHLQRCVAPASH